MGKNHVKLLYTQHIDIVQGNQGYIKRILKVRGCNDATIADVMEKIESIIEHSGKLGRVFQKDLDYKFIKEAKVNMNTAK